MAPDAPVPRQPGRPRRRRRRARAAGGARVGSAARDGRRVPHRAAGPGAVARRDPGRRAAGPAGGGGGRAPRTRRLSTRGTAVSRPPHARPSEGARRPPSRRRCARVGAGGSGVDRRGGRAVPEQAGARRLGVHAPGPFPTRVTPPAIALHRTGVRAKLHACRSGLGPSRTGGVGRARGTRGSCHTPAVGLLPRHFPPTARTQGGNEEGSIVERDDNALEMAVGQIEKQFGKGSIMRLGEHGNVGVAAIPTGALALDIALGIGGLPRGRVVEIYGPESSGKSTLAMHVVAEAQRNGGVCAYIDPEHAMDPIYAKAIGVDIDQLLISQPDTGEQALEIVDMLVRSGALDVVVIDSVAALTPRAEIEGEMGDSHVGLQARLMSQALRKLTANLNRSKTIAVFINQLREKIGVMFGSPEVTPGGRALKFYSSVRLDIRRIESIKDGAEVTGNRTRVKVVKNKVSPPFKQAEFDIMYGKGISREGSLLDVGVDLGIVKKSGAWYTYDGEQLGQGRENAKAFLAENPEVMVEISERVRQQAGVGAEQNRGFTAADDDPISLE